MSTEIIPVPAPDDEPSHDSGAGRSKRAKGRRATGRSIPSREACLEAMAALAGLVAMGYQTPAQGNAIRAIYDSILRQHDSAREGRSAQLADHDVLQLLEEQPHLIDLIEPLLTQQQLDMIMRKFRNDTDRQA